MKVKINCPKCKGVLVVPGDTSGRKARCAFCKNKFIIPSFNSAIDDMATQWLSMDALKDDDDDFLSGGPAQIQYEKADSADAAPGKVPIQAAEATHAAAAPSTGMDEDNLDDLNLHDIERELEKSDQTGTISKASSSGLVKPLMKSPQPAVPVPAPVKPAAKMPAPVVPKKPAPAPVPAPKPAVRPAAAAKTSGEVEFRLQDLGDDAPAAIEPRPVPSEKAPASKGHRASGEVEMQIDRTGQVKVVGKAAPPAPAKDEGVIEFSDEIEVIEIETPGVVDPAARSTVNLLPASSGRSDLERMMEGDSDDLNIEIDANESSALGFDPVEVVQKKAPPAAASPVPAARAVGPVDPSRISWGQLRLAIVEQTSSRVVFGFDVQALRSEGFRTSMPRMCLGCQKSEFSELLARPLIWVDRTVRRKLDEDEAQIARDLIAEATKYQAEVGRNRTATSVREVLKLMHEIPQVKDPFHLPMPYFVCKDCASETGLYCTIMPSEKGPWCQVQVTSPPFALAWLARVHGVTGDEYADLEKRVLFMTEVWRTIPTKVRRHLSGWFDFEPGEEFIGYLSDADFQQKEMGLAGIVVTDRRLSWHKYGKRGDLPNGSAAVLTAHKDGAFVEFSQDSGGKTQKMVRLRPDDATSLKLMLEEVESAIKISGL